jgi:ABC-2 type transport system ATP-binding protein
MESATTPSAGPGNSDVEGRAAALRLTGLHKEFGAKVAVDHIDLVVPRGSFFGLVGPQRSGQDHLVVDGCRAAAP